MPHPDQNPQLLAAIQALESQRALLGDVAVDTAIAALHAQLPSPEAPRPEPAIAFAG